MASSVTTPLSSADSYTKRIHKIYNEHWNTFENRRQTELKQIDEWYRTTEERIRNHMNKQKKCIDEHYKNLESILDEQCMSNRELAAQYHVARRTELFKELEEACQSLTFQIATLEFIKDTLDIPNVAIKDFSMTMKSDLDKDTRRRRRRDKTKNATENTITTNDRLQPNSPPISDQKQIIDQPQSNEIIKTKNSSSIITGHDSNNQTKNASELICKCPVCFMIFPKSMTRTNRTGHINEHYCDD